MLRPLRTGLSAIRRMQLWAIKDGSHEIDHGRERDEASLAEVQQRQGVRLREFTALSRWGGDHGMVDGWDRPLTHAPAHR